MSSRVAIAHTRERHRSAERVRALVREAVDHLGGMSAFVGRGDTVLIKPNQTVYYSAEEGCTTDPLVVGALIELCAEAGAGRIQVGESSGDYFSSLECMRITGVAAIAEKLGAELVDLGADTTPNRMVSIPAGEVVREAPLPAPLLDADLIIDAPKAKTHHYDPVSGALKNWVGVVNRRWRQDHHGDTDMIGRFCDLMMVSRPALCVADALIVGEGDGPIANQPRWCGCIVASPDPVATDVTLCRLLGRDPAGSRFCAEAERRGLGVREPLELVGAPLAEVAIAALAGHAALDHLPINVLVGTGVTLPGTVGHVKSVLDSMLRRGELEKVIWLRGTPTIMIGNVDDPAFEEHLREGPYLVFDDAAQARYKEDPRVHFVPGHPVLRRAMPELLDGLGVTVPGRSVMAWEKLERWGMHNLRYGSARRRVLTVGQVVATAALLGLGLATAALATRAVVRRSLRAAR